MQSVCPRQNRLPAVEGHSWEWEDFLRKALCLELAGTATALEMPMIPHSKCKANTKLYLWGGCQAWHCRAKQT